MLYRTILRPILFLFPPEVIHSLIVVSVRVLFRLPGVYNMVSYLFSYSHPSLERTVWGIRFPNPVGLAPGFDKNAEFYNEFGAFGFSFVEVGTVTPKAQSGNPQPRSFRLPSDKALVNRMGFNNKGVEAAVRNLRRGRRRVIVGGNIGKNTATPNQNAIVDYLIGFEKLYPAVDYIVVNISCPNIDNLRALQEIDSQRDILSLLVAQRAKQSQHKPILIKVSPDLTPEHLDRTIDLAMEVGIDGFVATNTTTQRDGLKTARGRIEAVGKGGLSGAPVREQSTQVIRQIARRTKGSMPIIGVGGVMTPADALEKLRAGATLIQLYTGFIYSGPTLPKSICKAIIKSGDET